MILKPPLLPFPLLFEAKRTLYKPAPNDSPCKGLSFSDYTKSINLLARDGNFLTNLFTLDSKGSENFMLIAI